jgi:hypothetical protein
VLSIRLALAVAVCVATAASSRPAAAADFPVGAYTIGEFTITFADAGQYRVSKGEEVVVEGEYKVNGDQLLLTDKGGSMACSAAGQQTGTYRWKYEGDALTLTKVEDACPGRSAAITAAPWKRKG